MEKTYKRFAKKVVELLGGSENIISVTNCATRLRFVLKDISKPNTEKIQKQEGVCGVIEKNGQYQVIIGPDVDLVMNEICQIEGIHVEKAGNKIIANKMEMVNLKKKKGLKTVLGDFINMVSSLFIPIIPCICGAGMLQAVLIVFKTAGWLSSDNQTYILLNTLSGSVFYYLPVLLAFSSAKIFGCNGYLASVIAFMLLHPTFMGLVDAAEPVRMFGIPVTLVKYSSSVIPIIFITYFMSIVEKVSKKYIPKTIKFIAVPVVTFLITSVVGLTFLGPIGTWCGEGLVIIFNWLDENLPWVCPVIMGAFSPLIVMTGMHNGLKSITYSQYALRGYATAVGPGSLASNIAQGAAALVIALRSKKSNKRQMALSASVSALIGGITEPALYGLTLKYKSVLWSVMLGGGVSGLWAGITRMRTYSPGAVSILGIPVYIGGEGFQNMYNAVICVVISFIVTMVTMLIFGMRDVWDAEKTEENNNEEELDDVLTI